MTEPTERLSAALADRYRIERELGEGGMATVYLAQDLKHDRRVAVKVLRPELAAVIGAERFLAEIKTTANLQHPHILPLHDSGEANSFLYYVMPYVEGESLRDRLARDKQLPIRETVRIAGEVADALDYAHRHGIVHRDVKPENVLLHDGRALVADFGIALAATSAGSRMTETGMSLGTPHYMSPEQALGERELTARSDVYALGAMTYEMLVGDPPFTGSTAQAIVAKVMTDKPVPPSRMRDTVPPEVEDAVLTALEKLPADRFESAARFAEALQGEGRPRMAASRGVPADVSPVRRWALPLALVVVTAAALWGWFRPLPERLTPPPSRLAILVPTLGGASSSLLRQVAITPDGSTLLYRAIGDDGQARTMRQRLDESQGVALPGVQPYLAEYTLSPDGTEFLGQTGGMQSQQLLRYPIDGGTGRPVAPGLPPSNHFVWGPDGSIWISGVQDVDRGIARVDADGTVTHPFGTDYVWLRPQQFLPDGENILSVRSPTGASAGPVELLNVARGSATRLLDLNVVQVLFTPGFLVYVQADGAMYAVPFDDRALALTGTPVQIATGVSLTGTGLAQFAVAGNGTVVYIPEEPRTLVRVARDGSRRALTEERKNFHAPRFSPDGRSLSMDFNTADGRDVWVLDLTGGALTRTTFDLDGHDATWTPDGRFLTYLTNRGPALGVFRVRPGSTEPPDSLLVSSAVTYTGLWLPDGSTLITVGNSLAGATGSDLAIIRDSGRGPVEPLVATRFQEAFPAPSPDGRWLAYSSNLSGRDEVYLRPLTGDGDQVQVSLEGGVEPVWSRDGSELFYRSGVGDGSMFLVARVTGTAIPTVTTRQVLFPVADIIGAIPHANYDVAPDGRSFVMVQQNPASRIMVIQNLPGLVERLSGSDIR